MNEEDIPTAADDIDLCNVENKHHPYNRCVFRRHDVMRNGRLGNIKLQNTQLISKKTPNHLNRLPTEYFRVPVISKALKSKNPLNAGVIEAILSEWAAPVVFLPEKYD